eukprot:TRINITY_DN3765_c0_g1_i3.p1 TRINITY_DN3765_c0_g1~~TRINITY_DN3765_c0_g1_i3.p1  ORF type:complete len:181 (+),score=31.05 TRINITY_DN3765_c0_g1_i3:408-950(+)
MYFESQVLSKWPFITAFIFTCLCSIIASSLQIITNRDIFSAIGLVGYGTYFLFMFAFGVYYYHKMMVHLAQKSEDGTVSEGLRAYRRFFWSMSCVVFGIALVEFYQVVLAIVSEGVFYEPSKMETYQFDILVALILVALASQTWWPWKPFPWCEKYMMVEVTSATAQALSTHREIRVASK